MENFICHNGDFEFFQIGGEWYDTTAVQRWLERATGVKMPSVVDSAAIAGVVDLLRTQAGWGGWDAGLHELRHPFSLGIVHFSHAASAFAAWFFLPILV